MPWDLIPQVRLRRTGQRSVLCIWRRFLGSTPRFLPPPPLRRHCRGSTKGLVKHRYLRESYMIGIPACSCAQARTCIRAAGSLPAGRRTTAAAVVTGG